MDVTARIKSYTAMLLEKLKEAVYEIQETKIPDKPVVQTENLPHIISLETPVRKGSFFEIDSKDCLKTTEYKK
jgi:hypothetical protein